MPVSKKNDVIEEQRRARQEFLDLKKMQNGEMKAPPKPSEEAILPKTPKEKMANFWFQYKWHTIAIVAITIVLSILITQCATRTKYDFEVVYFTYTPVLSEQTDSIEKYIEKYAHDLNGDGKVNVQVIDCSYNKSNNGQQYEYTMLTKLQALIAGDESALLFITDKDSYKYFESLSDSGSIFEGEPLLLGNDFYTKTANNKYGKLKDGLQISCRKIGNTMLEKKKNTAKIHKESLGVIESIRKEIK